MFKDDFSAYASPEIIIEYAETYNEVHKKYSERGNSAVLQKIVEKLNVIVPERKISVCRDPDDDKFISCAIEGKCLYIVSGDNDLLSLGKIKNIKVVTISEFLKLLEC